MFYELNLTETKPSQYVSTAQKSLKDYYNFADSGPVAVRYFQNGQDSLNHSFIGNGLYNRFVPAGYYGKGFEKFCVSNDAYYYFSPFSDSIYKYSAALQYQMAFCREIKSAYSRTRLPFIKLDSGNLQNELDEQADKKAFYRDMRYDKYRHYIYLSFYHEAPKDAPVSKQRTHRPWSILVFDENLNPMGEHVFAADTYDPDNIITTPKGLFIKQITNDYSHGYPYTLFEVHG